MSTSCIEAMIAQYKARPEGKKTVMGKETKGRNLMYLAARAIIMLVCELMLGLS